MLSVDQCTAVGIGAVTHKAHVLCPLGLNQPLPDHVQTHHPVAQVYQLLAVCFAAGAALKSTPVGLSL